MCVSVGAALAGAGGTGSWSPRVESSSEAGWAATGRALARAAADRGECSRRHRAGRNRREVPLGGSARSADGTPGAAGTKVRRARTAGVGRSAHDERAAGSPRGRRSAGPRDCRVRRPCERPARCRAAPSGDGRERPLRRAPGPARRAAPRPACRCPRSGSRSVRSAPTPSSSSAPRDSSASALPASPCSSRPRSCRARSAIATGVGDDRPDPHPGRARRRRHGLPMLGDGRRAHPPRQRRPGPAGGDGPARRQPAAQTERVVAADEQLQDRVRTVLAIAERLTTTLDQDAILETIVTETQRVLERRRHDDPDPPGRARSGGRLGRDQRRRRRTGCRRPGRARAGSASRSATGRPGPATTRPARSAARLAACTTPTPRSSRSPPISSSRSTSRPGDRRALGRSGRRRITGRRPRTSSSRPPSPPTPRWPSTTPTCSPGPRRGPLQLAVLQAASARMSRQNTIASVGRAIVEETRGIIDYHNCRVYVLEQPDDARPDRLRGPGRRLRQGRHGAAPDQARRRASPAGSPRTASRSSSTTRTPTRAARRSPAPTMSTSRCSCVPMRYDERVIGVITLSKLGLRQFDEDDLRLLTILADQAATAVESARSWPGRRRLAGRAPPPARHEQRARPEPRPARGRRPHRPRTWPTRSASTRRAISCWDRPGDRLLTLGYCPIERPRGRPAEFALAGFPADPRVLDEQIALTVDVDDPECRRRPRSTLLRIEGNRSLLMLPLVAKGRSIGLVELMIADADGVRRGPARARPDDGQRGGDGPRERQALRGRPGARRPRPADRLPQPPLPARAPRRGDRPAAAVGCAAQPPDDRPRRLQARQRHVRPPLRRPGPGLDRRADPVRPPRLATCRPATAATSSRSSSPTPTPRAASMVARRIVQAFRDRPYESDSRGSVPVTASIGVATYQRDGRTGQELIAAADQGLYRVKAAGGHGSAGPADGRRTGPGRPRAEARTRRSRRASTAGPRASTAGWLASTADRRFTERTAVRRRRCPGRLAGLPGARARRRRNSTRRDRAARRAPLRRRSGTRVPGADSTEVPLPTTGRPADRRRIL